MWFDVLMHAPELFPFPGGGHETLLQVSPHKCGPKVLVDRRIFVGYRPEGLLESLDHKATFVGLLELGHPHAIDS